MAESIQTIRRKPQTRISWLSVAVFVASFSVVLAVGYAWTTGSLRLADLRLHYSEPYQLASGLALEDPLIRESIGNVQHVGWFPRGKLTQDGAEGACELNLTLHGEKANATLEASLVKRGGIWFWEWANLRTVDDQLLTLAVP